jgi:hypothetical protein
MQLGALMFPSAPWLGGVATEKINDLLSISLAISVMMAGVFSLVVLD